MLDQGKSVISIQQTLFDDRKWNTVLCICGITAY